MKRFFFVSLILLIAVSSNSCKKNKTNKCIVSMTAIAGYYKTTKATKAGADVTATFLSDCQQNATLQLYAGGDAVYDDAVCSSGETTSRWDIDVTNNKIHITSTGGFVGFSDGNITSWDCSTLVVTQNYSGSDYVITLTKTQ